MIDLLINHVAILIGSLVIIIVFVMAIIEHIQARKRIDRLYELRKRYFKQ